MGYQAIATAACYPIGPAVREGRWPARAWGLSTGRRSFAAMRVPSAKRASRVDAAGAGSFATARKFASARIGKGLSTALLTGSIPEHLLEGASISSRSYTKSGSACVFMVCACVALPTHVRTTSALHLVRSFLKLSIMFKHAHFGSADGPFARRGGAFALFSRAY